MKITHTVLPLVLLVVSSVAVASEPTAFDARADAYLSELVEAKEFSGAVLVARNGKVVFSKGYGLANREHGVANTAETIFRLGSVTKQFTAMCILILQEDEKLAVTDPICRYVEDCSDAWKKITIHHLLTHTSGIPSFTSFPDNLAYERQPTTVQATIGRFRDKPLTFEPGTKMGYSNSGYVLLGSIIEKVSGTSYEDFVTSRIFKPLSMSHSGYDRPARVLLNRAAGYSKGEDDEIVNCIPFAMDTPHAAGALCSTVGDLLIWDRSLHSEKLVSPDTLNRMFTPFTEKRGKGSFQNRPQPCYGWFKSQAGNRTEYEHSGGISGFKSKVIRIPQDGVYIAVLSNFEWVDASAIATKLRDMFFEGK